MTGLDTGTGRVSSYCLQEELTPKVLGANPASKVWLRRRRNSYQPILSYVPTNLASAYDAPSQGLAVESVVGMHDIEVDMRSIGWLLKAFFGSHSVAGNAGIGYTHTFTPGSSEKTFQILENKGGFSSAYYRKYQAMFPNRITFNTGINDWLWASVGYIGLAEVAGTDPGTPAPESDTSVMAGFNQIQYYIGTVGATAISSMTVWTDANDMRLDLTRPDAIADDYRSDGTGKSSSIFPGTFTPAINLMSRFASTHKLTTFDARTKIAFGVRVDTGTEIVAAGQHYQLDFIFPRCTIQSYSIDFQGTGQSVPVMAIVPEIDPTATWSTKAILYNNISDYASPT